MYLTKKLSNFYNSKSSESFITSIVILLSGFFILSSSSLFIGNFDIIYLFYALVTWLWLRLNEEIFNFLLKKKIDKILSFSISWIIPIIIITRYRYNNPQIKSILLSFVLLVIWITQVTIWKIFHDIYYGI